MRCSVGVSVCLVCCVFDSACELFGETIRNEFGCGCCFVNVMDVFSVGEVLCWIYRVWSSTECACCACDPSVHLSVPSICFVRVLYVEFCKSLITGSQVFALLMLFLWVIVHTMWSGKSLQLLCILPFGMLCLSAISMMFVKIMLVGMVV